MAAFEVNCKKLRRCALKQAGTVRNLSRCTTRIQSCGKQLSALSSENAAVCRVLDAVGTDLDTHAESIREMATALGEIADLYAGAEESVCEKEVTVGNLTEAEGETEEDTGEKSNVLWEDALISGSVSGAGSFLGFDTEGTLSGSILGGSVSKVGKATWDLKDKDAEISVGLKSEGYLAQGKVEGSLGYLGGEMTGTVGAAGASGTAGLSLYQDGKLAPAIFAKAKAEAAAAKGEAEVSLGSENYNVHAKASGTAAGAEASASVQAGKVVYTNSKGKAQTETGVAAEAGVGAYAAKGEVSGGVTIFGIEIDLTASGSLGSVGASVGGRITTGGISGKIGGALGLGGGLEISIDWSGFSLW